MQNTTLFPIRRLLCFLVTSPHCPLHAPCRQGKTIAVASSSRVRNPDLFFRRKCSTGEFTFLSISLWSRDPSLLRAGIGPCSKTATERTVGLKPPIWHRPSPDPIHFTIFISDSTSIFPSSSAPLPARPLFLQEPSNAHHATNSKSDPTHPKQDKKTQRQDAVCI